MDKNFEKQRQEKMKKNEESNKVLENKGRFLNGENEKLAINQKENEKRIQDKNNYIKEILQEKENIFGKHVRIEQDRFKLFQELKEKEAKISELILMKETLVGKQFYYYRFK